MSFSNIIPIPKEISLQGGVVTIDSNWGIDNRSGCPEIGQRYAKELNNLANAWRDSQ